MLWMPRSSDTNLYIPSVADGTRPAAAFGTSVTPGNNTYGSYVSMIAGASVTHDVYGFWSNFNSNSASTAARDSLATLGLDAAGGSSFTDFISHIQCSSAGPYFADSAGVGGYWYWWPVFVQAGTSFGVKATVNNATVNTLRAHVILCCKPDYPNNQQLGTFVQTFGANPGTSTGTTITPGTASEGAYADVGTLDKNLWYWQFGFGLNDGAMPNSMHSVDLAIGDATNKKIAILNGFCTVSSTEAICKRADGGFCKGASGDHVYMRAQAGPNAAGANASGIAYGIGG